jgi:hypothetical protein
MRELTKAMFSYTLAAPLFAIQQLANGLNSARSDEMGEKATQAYQNLTRATMDQLGDMLQALFKASDEIQRDMVDMGFRLFEPETWTPSGIARTTADMTSRLADGMRYMDPSTEGLAAWRELVNKLQIYFLVIDIKSKLKIPEGRFDLHEYVVRPRPVPCLVGCRGSGTRLCCRISTLQR